ncbi:MAG: universal stress protein [Gemmatimonadetes bacterium]|nr:universal stress protein [Gemmatimonadota bacterium]
MTFDPKHGAATNGEETMYKSILVSLDGSETAEQALRPAASIARRSDATLHLARVPVASLGGSIDMEYGKVDSHYMGGVAERLRSAGLPSVKVAVLEVGDVATQLEKHRAEVGADLTVMCSHGRGTVERAWLGSVSDRFVRHTDAPVLIVRASPGARTDDLATDVTFERVMVPLDGSALSESALGPATELGGRSSSYLLVRVLEAPYAMGAGVHPSLPMAPGEGVGAARQWADADIGSSAKAFEARGFSVESVTQVGQPVARAILDAAKSHAADVIAMATHGRGGVTRAWMGSVTDKVVRGTECPVLIVRPRAA